MFAKPIDNTIKAYFDSIYQEAENTATLAYENLKQEINGLNHYRQVVRLVEEKGRADKMVDNDPHPYYARNSMSPDSLLTQFANRTFLLGIDESDELINAVIAGQYRRQLSEHLRNMEESIPKYTYQMFINGVHCPYFLTLPSYYTTDRKTHDTIRDWQADHMQQIVTYDYLNMIAAIQRTCQGLAEPLDYIVAESDKAANLLDNTAIDIASIRTGLAQLNFLNHQIIPQFNDELLIEHLSMYRAQKLDLKSVTPAYVKKPLSLIKQKHKEMIGDEVTLFFTIDKVADWLSSVVEGMPLQKTIKEPKWNEIISAAKYKATKEVKTLTKDIEKVAYDKAVPPAEIKTYLLKTFDRYRQKFNEFEHKDIFQGLSKGAEKLLKRVIIANSFFSNNTDLHLKILHDGILIQEMIWVTVQIYADVFDTHRLEYPDDDRSYMAVHSLLNSMVLDKELYDMINQSFDEFMVQHENYFFPYDVLFQNQKENMHHIFHRGIKRLQDVLNNAEPSNKVLYLQTRLKELRQRELQMKEFAEDRDIGKYDDRYSVFLKDFLLIETDFINETKGITATLPLTLGNKKPFLQLPESFASFLPDKKGAFVLNLLEDLSLTRNGVSTISVRKKGALRGVVEALTEANIAPAKSLEVLCKIIADKIGLELKSKLDHSNISEEYKTKARKYIKAHNSVA